MKVTVEWEDGGKQTFDVNPEGPGLPDMTKEEPYQPYKDDTTIEDDECVANQTTPVAKDEPGVVCFLCGEEIVNPEDLYCFGCRTYICPDHIQTPWGRHKPEAHDEP
jgi:hypothetical protein